MTRPLAPGGSVRRTASPCPLCGQDEGREVFRRLRPTASLPTGRPSESLYGRAGRLVRCDGCGLVRQDPAVSVPYEDAADPDYLSEEEGIRVTFRRALERIERYRTTQGRLLDVGCGPGLLLEEARRLGWEAVGVEPSTWSVEEARRRGLRVHHGTLGSDDLREGSFGAIVASDVVEHVPDPVAFVRRIGELLEPSGVVLFTTPNVDSFVARVLRRWWWSVLPGHLLYFSPETLRRLLETVHLEPLELDTHPKTFSLTYYAGRLCGYSEAMGNAARTVADALGGRRRLVTPNFRDRIACVARKPGPHRAWRG